MSQREKDIVMFSFFIIFILSAASFVSYLLSLMIYPYDRTIVTNLLEGRLWIAGIAFVVSLAALDVLSWNVKTTLP